MKTRSLFAGGQLLELESKTYNISRIKDQRGNTNEDRSTCAKPCCLKSVGKTGLVTDVGFAALVDQRSLLSLLGCGRQWERSRFSSGRLEDHPRLVLSTLETKRRKYAGRGFWRRPGRPGLCCKSPSPCT